MWEIVSQLIWMREAGRLLDGELDNPGRGSDSCVRGFKIVVYEHSTTASHFELWATMQEFKWNPHGILRKFAMCAAVVQYPLGSVCKRVQVQTACVQKCANWMELCAMCVISVWNLLGMMCKRVQVWIHGVMCKFGSCAKCAIAVHWCVRFTGNCVQATLSLTLVHNMYKCAIEEQVWDPLGIVGQKPHQKLPAVDSSHCCLNWQNYQ